jgi:hypothetical protein
MLKATTHMNAKFLHEKRLRQLAMASEQEAYFTSLPEVLTTREGALALRCSKAHFCNLINGKVAGVPQIPSVRLGRRALVRKTTLVSWIEQVESSTRQR